MRNGTCARQTCKKRANVFLCIHYSAGDYRDHFHAKSGLYPSISSSGLLVCRVGGAYFTYTLISSLPRTLAGWHKDGFYFDLLFAINQSINKGIGKRVYMELTVDTYTSAHAQIIKSIAKRTQRDKNSKWKSIVRGTLFKDL